MSGDITGDGISDARTSSGRAWAEEWADLQDELRDDDQVWPHDTMINGLVLKCTCSSCPEQYDVYDGPDQVAYFRLRHGFFYAAVPECGGQTIYTAEPRGDGIFCDDERERYLREAVNAVWKHRIGDTADAILRDMPQSIVTKLLALMYADSQSPVSHEWHAWLTRRSDYLGIVTAETEDV